MTLVPPDGGAVQRHLSSPDRFARGPLTRSQRWIRDEIGTQLDEVAGMAIVAERVMDLDRGIAVRHQMLFRQSLEAVGGELEETRARYGTAGADHAADQFTGTADIPALLTAFSQESLKNLGSALLATQELTSRNMAEVINRGVKPPEDVRHGRRSFW